MIDSRNGVRLFQLIPPREFQKLCDQWRVDFRTRKLTAQRHVWAMILAYLFKLESLREIEGALGVPRSTLSDANANRTAGFFDDLCRLLLWKIQSRIRGARKIRRSIRTVLALDSSSFQVDARMTKQHPDCRGKASKGNRRAGYKFHVIWNVGGQWIEEFRFSSVRAHDAPTALRFRLRPRCTYVFDRAYNDLLFWRKILRRGSHFVTRLKEMPWIKEKTKALLTGPKQQGVIWDGAWRPSQILRRHRQRGVTESFVARHICYRDPATKKIFHFVTSDFNSSGREIAEIYRKRWAVELLFKWLKGHYNIRLLQPRNKNAIQVQLTMAVVVQLLIKLYALCSRLGTTLWDVLRHLRIQLLQCGYFHLIQFNLFNNPDPRGSPITASS